MKHIFTIAILAAAASCSPKVVSNISTNLEPLPVDAKVLVSEVGMPSPANGVLLGDFAVKDAGASVKCSYGAVVALARNEARQVGGNFVDITRHQKPDVWSSCNRIYGSIYRVDVPSLKFKPAADSLVPIAADLETPAMIEYMMDENRETLKPERKLPKFRLAIDAGSSIRSSKIAANMPESGLSDSDWRSIHQGLRTGFMMGASATGFFDDFYGLGGKFVWSRYSHNFKGLNLGVNTIYFGPEWITRLPSRKGKGAWIFGVSAGYVHYREKASYNGLSLSKGKGSAKGIFEVGYDFLISGKTFVGVKVGTSIGSLKMKVDNIGKEYTNSLNTWEFGAGIRF